MAVDSNVVELAKINIVAGVAIPCAIPVYGADEVIVYYGTVRTVATLTTDYVVTLDNAGDLVPAWPTTFSITPLAPLLTKIAALADPTNVIHVRRELDYLSDFLATDAFFRDKIVAAFDKNTMRMQQLAFDFSLIQNLEGAVDTATAQAAAATTANAAAQTAKTDTLAAEAAALAAATEVSNRVYNFFSSRAAALAAGSALFNPLADRLITYGWAAAGDGFFGIFKKVGGDPGHAFAFQTQDGTWWEQEMEGRSATLLARGADRNNTVDATDAIQKCVEYVDALWIPPGNYKVDGSVNFTRNGLSMAGPRNAVFNINNAIYGFGWGQDGVAKANMSLVGFTMNSSRADNYLCKIAHISEDLNFVRMQMKNGFNHFKLEESTYGIDWDRVISENSADYAYNFAPTTFGFCNSHSVRRPEFSGCIGSMRFNQTTAVSVVCPRVERWLDGVVPAGAVNSFLVNGSSQNIHFDMAGGYHEDHSALYAWVLDGAQSVSITGRSDIDCGYNNSTGFVQCINTCRDIHIADANLGLASQTREPIDLGGTIGAVVERIRVNAATNMGVAVVAGALPTKQTVRDIRATSSSPGTIIPSSVAGGMLDAGRAVAFGAYNGVSTTLQSGYGITAARNSAGSYTFTFTDAMFDGNYTVVIGGTPVSNGSNICIPYVSARLAASFTVIMQPTGAGAGGAAVDSDLITFAVYGRKANNT